MSNNKLCVKHAKTVIDIIREKAPMTVEGMPYARTFIYEQVGIRFSEDNPLQCDAEYPYTLTSVANMNRRSNGIIKHFPELEKLAFEITQVVLPQVQADGLSFKKFSKHIEDCI